MGYDNSPALVLLLGGDPPLTFVEEPPLELSLEESPEEDPPEEDPPEEDPPPPEDPLAATLAIKQKTKIE
ncbi:hypothetical protein INT48_009111 [Thamnidium elegans]|uniref:Uncharacterized protein n=1 Tax=Thamnidium elegans TaxID=101142 RepID=A0A8H7VYH6_9FUNG|nr:hypothetical protein INT48_009111 [Thamnidium elegans]